MAATGVSTPGEPAGPEPDLPERFSGGTVRMGLRPLAEAEWILLGPDVPEQLAAKRRLLAERCDDVAAFLPGSEAAAAESLARLARHLPRHHPDAYADEGGRLRCYVTGDATNLRDPPDGPLVAAARLVPDDHAILLPSPEGYRLAAGAICFPSNWSLAEKLGRPLAVIHEPVPGYAAALAAPVDRLFDRLAPGGIVVRANWLVHDTDALFQHGHVPAPVAPERVGEALFLRVERQTLRRLPESGAVLFAIRTRVTPLAAAIRDRARAADLAAALRAMPPELAAYRRTEPFLPALLRWLDERARADNSAAAGLRQGDEPRSLGGERAGQDGGTG